MKKLNGAYQTHQYIDKYFSGMNPKIINNLTVLDRIASVPINRGAYPYIVMRLINSYGGLEVNYRLNLIEEFLLNIRTEAYQCIQLIARDAASTFLNIDVFVKILSLLAHSGVNNIRLNAEIIVPALIELIDPRFAEIIPTRVIILFLYNCEDQDGQLIDVLTRSKTLKRSKESYGTSLDNIIKYLTDPELNKIIGDINHNYSSQLETKINGWLQDHQMNPYNGHNLIAAIRANC